MLVSSRFLKVVNFRFKVRTESEAYHEILRRAQGEVWTKFFMDNNQIQLLIYWFIEKTNLQKLSEEYYSAGRC